MHNSTIWSNTRHCSIECIDSENVKQIIGKLFQTLRFLLILPLLAIAFVYLTSTSAEMEILQHPASTPPKRETRRICPENKVEYPGDSRG
jgi:hypothetical protein